MVGDMQLNSILWLLLLLALAVKSGHGQEEVYIEYEILEEQSPQTFVGNIISDGGLGDSHADDVLRQLRFAFLNPLSTEYFQMETESGLLWTAQTLDRELICPQSTTCELTLDIAVQPIEYFQIIKVSVRLVDLNDNTPTFEQEVILLEISETTSPGATFALPTAIDLDSGTFGINGYALRSSTDAFDLEVSTQGAKEVHLVVKEGLGP